MLMMSLWLALLGFLVWNGAILFNAHYVNWKVQDVFDNVVKNMRDSSEAEIREKLPTLYKIQYLSPNDLPREFYDNLEIKQQMGMLEISSIYSVVVWPFGPVEKVDEEGEYDPEQLEGMDLLRDRSRIDLQFEPYAISN